MSFCPVCGEAGQGIGVRCERVARHYGYARADLEALAAAGSSTAVPFFDVRRFFFAIDSLATTPLARAMLDAVERDLTSTPVEERGNPVRVVPFQHADFPEHASIYVKEDVSKAMAVYQAENAIEHFGSEERAVVFADVAAQFFGLEEHVPTTVGGVSPRGTKFVASAGLSRDRFASLEARPRADLRDPWQRGVLAPLALLDFVLGQNDRNAQNVLVSDDPAPRIRLIDNDDAFATSERLASPFAYLASLGEDASLAVARAWFAPLRLGTLVARLAPLALPADVMTSLGRRFAFAQMAVHEGWSLAAFKRAAFVDRGPFDWRLPHVPWTVCRTFVKRRSDGVRFRTLVGQAVGDSFEVTVLGGELLAEGVTVLAEVRARSAGEADRAVEALSVDAVANEFAHVVRRRFFVAPADAAVAPTQTLRIVEVRTDPSGCHLIARTARFGRHEARRIERFVSFANVAQAVAAADAFEAELLAARFEDLRARLESTATMPAEIF